MNSSSSNPSSSNHPRIAIIGAGIIGASISYYLAKLDHQVTIFEQAHIACAASGKSGGFLASDWCDDSALRHLARPSFDIHKQLSTCLNAQLSYRTLDAYSISLVDKNSPTASYQSNHNTNIKSLQWLNGHAKIVARPNRIGSQNTCAQVLPNKLTNAFIQNAKQLVNSKVVLEKVDDVKWNHQQKAWQLSTTDNQNNQSNYLFDIVILSMGPWTINAKKWFPNLPPIMAQKAASIIVKTQVSPTALFTEYVDSNGQARTPEAYPRVGEVYLCQSAVPEELPSVPDDIHIDRQDVNDLKEFGRALNQNIAEAVDDDTKIISQACNLPISPDGLPIIGVVGGTDNSVFVATGHSCWGILNSPATGKAIAELIVSGKSSIKINAFSPSRFVEK